MRRHADHVVVFNKNDPDYYNDERERISPNKQHRKNTSSKMSVNINSNNN